MKIEHILDRIVFIGGGDMDALLDSGVVPRAVIDRVVDRGHVPGTHLATAKMVGQAAYFVNRTAPAVDIPGLYTVAVNCVDDDGWDYPVRVEVAGLDWC